MVDRFPRTPSVLDVAAISYASGRTGESLRLWIFAVACDLSFSRKVVQGH